jgi:GT2 family glycosyltransferase
MLSIIIVNYFTRDHVAACVESIREHASDVDLEVIVVDNSREDDVRAAVEPVCPDAIVIESPRNLGFGAACNLAGGRARGEHILLINPDVVVLPGAIQEILAFAARRPEGGIWGGRTLRPDGSLNPASCWRAMSTWSLLCRILALDNAMPDSPLFNYHGYGGWSRADERDVEVVSGCFLLIAKPLWDALGGFDEQFFVYGEDVDLCLRAAGLGYRPCITPRATVIHEGGSSEKVKAGKMIRLLTANAQLIRKHAGRPGAVVQAALLQMWPLSRYLAFRLARTLGMKRCEAGLQTWREVWRALRDQGRRAHLPSSRAAE